MLRCSIRSSLRSRHINWEGATAPLPNPPPRPATGSHHENGPQHSYRKTQRRSPGRSPHLQRPRERTATTDPKKASGEKREWRSSVIPHSKSLQRCSSTTGEGGKIDPPGPSFERSFSGPIKRLSGTTDRVASSDGVCKITHHEQRGDHQAAGTGGLGPRGRQGRPRQVQAPRPAGPCGRAASAQGPRARHLAQHLPASGLGVGLRCSIQCTFTPVTRTMPTA